MIIPERLPPSDSLNMIRKVLKALYGLMQSSRTWYQQLNQHLLLNEFQRLKSDASIYLKSENDRGFINTTIYVDDCMLLRNKISLIQQVKTIIQTKFEI